MLKDYHGDFREVARDLLALSDIVFSKKEEVARHAGILPTSQDARLVALDGIQQSLIAVGYWINALTSLKSDCSGQEKVYLGKLGVGPGAYPGDPHRVGKIEDLLLNLQFGALVVLVHFRIDNLFFNLLRALGKTVPSSFEGKTDAVLSCAELSVPGPEKDAIKALTQVRNSYHNNGMHRNADFHASVAGVPYDFTRDQRVDTSWAQVLHLMDAVVRALGLVLSSQQVRQLAGGVKDDFASGVVQP